MSGKTKYVIAVVGPTAVGKTRVAIDIARELDTEIISADSRQCYREMNIGVARPTPEELAAAPHHFIASHSVQDPLTAADYEQQALAKAEKIFLEKDHLVLVGGTGLYIRAFLEGLDPIPDVPDDIRRQVQESYALNGIEWLQQQVREKDPLYFKEGEIQNPHRLLRALEVAEATGQSIISFQKREKKQRPFQTIMIGLDLPRPELYQRINDRVLQMMKDGQEAEARSLYHLKHLPALQTVGYSELFEYFDGKISLEKAVEFIQQNTRNYAKRQLTWFRRQHNVEWHSPNGKDFMKALRF